MTSAEANKKLALLRTELAALVDTERKSCTFIAATVEDPEEIRPEYSISDTAMKISDLNEQIRDLKHRINKFNVSFVIPGVGMTIDQALIYLPQLREQMARFADMASRLDKVRVTSYAKSSGLIEYEYANYDIRQARLMYEEARDELARVQLALDRVNSSVDIE